MVSATETASMRHWATSITLRRLKLSPPAADGSESSMIGSVVDACTSATMLAESEMAVIIQAAPTPWISDPKFEARLAIHTDWKMPCRKGANGEVRSVKGSSLVAGSAVRRQDYSIASKGGNR